MQSGRTCKVCLAPLGRKPGAGRWPHYCSPECRREAQRVTPAAKTCEHCGRDFKSSRDAKMCSIECRNRARAGNPKHQAKARERARANYAPRSAITFIVCRYCNELACVRMATAIKCRKPECNLTHRALVTAERRARQGRENYGYTDATAAAYHRRRALKRGATVENFTPVEIYDRDNWTCGLCSEPVDRNRKWPDPLSVSLDHIVPLALGGDHSRANTQCAHLSCNVRKGARVA